MYIFSPPDDIRGFLGFTAELCLATQTPVSPTADQRPVKNTSVVGSCGMKKHETNRLRHFVHFLQERVKFGIWPRFSTTVAYEALD